MSGNSLKLVGVAVVILLLVVGIAMMKGRRTESVVAPASVVQQVVETPVEKPKPQRDMLDDNAAPTQQIVAQPALVQATNTGKAVLDLSHLANEIKLTSTQLKTGEKMSLYYTCNQKNVSPPLGWTNAPRATKSYVVFMEGPDKGRGPVLQWGVYDIAGSANGLPEGLPKLPKLDNGEGQAVTDVGPVGYSGPCVPKGEATFTFSVFALDTELKLPGGVSKDDLIRAMNGHIIDMAKLPVQHYFRL